MTEQTQDPYNKNLNNRLESADDVIPETVDDAPPQLVSENEALKAQLPKEDSLNSRLENADEVK